MVIGSLRKVTFTILLFYSPLCVCVYVHIYIFFFLHKVCTKKKWLILPNSTLNPQLQDVVFPKDTICLLFSVFFFGYFFS